MPALYIAGENHKRIVQHNFMVGTLSPRESWGVKEVWPMQMLDLEVAFKFYESGD